jgi:hypothetical protein
MRSAISWDVALVRTGSSEELVASMFRVEK